MTLQRKRTWKLNWHCSTTFPALVENFNDWITVILSRWDYGFHTESRWDYGFHIEWYTLRLHEVLRLLLHMFNLVVYLASPKCLDLTKKKIGAFQAVLWKQQQHATGVCGCGRLWGRPATAQVPRASTSPKCLCGRAVVRSAFSITPFTRQTLP